MITIYIGDNGSGKSQQLAELTKKALSDGKNVIAIATAINDKFPKRNKNKPYHYMGSRMGRFVAREAMKDSFRNIGDKSEKLISSVFQILKYAKFEERIGFEIRGFETNFDDIIFRNEIPENEDFEALSSVLYRIRSYINSKGEGILWVDSYTIFSEGLSGEVLILLLKYEKLMKKYKLIKSIEIHLEKNNDFFPLIHASSGELSLIATTIFIASKIDDNTTILIDEPENSLHPDWQRKYVSNLVNIFPYYALDVRIATHSPLLISGALNEPDVSVMKHNGITFEPVKSDIKNVEEAYIEQFGIVTPESNALSEQCIEIINYVESGELSKDEAKSKLLFFREKSFDMKQKTFIDGVISLIDTISGGK